MFQNLEVFTRHKDDIEEVENRYVFYDPINMQSVNYFSQSDRELIIKQFKIIKKLRQDFNNV